MCASCLLDYWLQSHGSSERVALSPSFLGLLPCSAPTGACTNCLPLLGPALTAAPNWQCASTAHHEATWAWGGPATPFTIPQLPPQFISPQVSWSRKSLATHGHARVKSVEGSSDIPRSDFRPHPIMFAISISRFRYHKGAWQAMFYVGNNR